MHDYYARKAENAIYEATIILGCIVAAGILVLFSAILQRIH